MKSTIFYLYLDCFASFFKLTPPFQILVILCILGGGLLSHLMEELRGKTALGLLLVYLVCEVLCRFLSEAEIYLTSLVGIMLLSVLTGFVIYFIACRVRTLVKK